MKNALRDEFIQQSISRLEENTPKIEKCLNDLSEDEVWQRPNQSSNSIGNMILHLCGNITQYILSGLGHTEDKRERDKEFSARDGYTKDELLISLKSTVSKAIDTIRNLSEEDLLKKRTIQVYDLTGTGIIIHVVEHYSYHTGQIIFWTKVLRDKDLGFYSSTDLRKKNRS